MNPAARAFSLVEVLIVVIVMGILAAVVVPGFNATVDDARTSATQSALAGVRSAVSSFRSRAIITGADPYPTLAELTTPGTVLRQDIPANPFTGVGGVQAVSLAQAQARTVVAPAAAGWNYHVDNAADPPVAIFYANADDTTNTPDGAGGTKTASEL